MIRAMAAEHTIHSHAFPTENDLAEARQRIDRHVYRTPLVACDGVAELAGVREVRLKCENLQRTGSFKIRGALNAVLSLEAERRIGPGGLVTYSSGNHGQAVAWAARAVGGPATIVVPEDVSPAKEKAMAHLGATIIRAGRTSDDRHSRALGVASELKAEIIPPFDDPRIVAGQSTVGEDIIADDADAEIILVPVGGGGLAAGVALAVAYARDRGLTAARIIAVEPVGADSLRRSLAAGEPVSLTEAPKTIADGLRPLRVGDLPFAIAREHIDEVLLVDDDAIRATRRLILERAKLFVEPSGAAALAGLLSHSRRFSGKRVVAVLSGGNAPTPEL